MKKTVLKNMCAAIAVVIAVSSFAGCASKKDTLTQIKQKGELVMGTSADYEPYEYHKSINGQDTIVGFDINIANRIADDLGVKLKIEEMDFDGLLTALNTGKVDIVIAGMNPTEERKKSVDFSTTYYEAVQTVLVRAEDKDKFTSIESFNGAVVSAQKGTSQEDVAVNQLTGAKVEALAKVPDLVLNLQYNKCDAVVLEGPVAEKYVANSEGLAIANFEFPENGRKGAAVAVRKGSDTLLAEINASVAKMWDDGTMQTFIEDAFVKGE